MSGPSHEGKTGMSITTYLRLDTDDIRSSVDAVALIGGTVKLVRKGRGYWGHCPFHNDSTPSFKVEGHRYICFGCAAKGDAIQWVTETEHQSFIEVVWRLRDGAATGAVQFLKARSAPVPGKDRRRTHRCCAAGLEKGTRTPQKPGLASSETPRHRHGCTTRRHRGVDPVASGLPVGQGQQTRLYGCPFLKMP